MFRLHLHLARCCEHWHERVSPRLPPTCRYTPTCSVYAAEALRRYGVLKGTMLAVKRIRRCRPPFPPGHDPVP